MTKPKSTIEAYLFSYVFIPLFGLFMLLGQRLLPKPPKPPKPKKATVLDVKFTEPK